MNIPPQAIDIEEGVLGVMLLDPKSLSIAVESITPETFYNTSNQLIFEQMVAIHNSGKECDLLSLEQALKDKEIIDLVGGFSYLVDLTSRGSAGNFEYHLQIIKEKQVLRNIISSCDEVIKKAYSNHNVFEVVDEVSKIGSDIDSTEKHSLTPDEIKERDKNKPKDEKLFLGYSELDYGIYGDGNKKGQVELTIADSGHGKTQYALFKIECFLRRGYKVGWFQLEGYDSETSDHFFTNGIESPNIYICDSLYDIEHIKRECRRLNREHNIDCFVFDYVQNIECSQKISKNEKVEYISKQITKMAKELNVVAHVLSQVTIDRSRTGWACEPRYDDVRWSQQLKQDASLITSVFRPSKIDSLVLGDSSVKDWNELPVPYNSVFVKQSKVRHGQQTWKRQHLIHTDKGLKPYEASI